MHLHTWVESYEIYTFQGRMSTCVQFHVIQYNESSCLPVKSAVTPISLCLDTSNLHKFP